ncbi:hypothetical protein J5TS2_32840 [Brevibacillus halotolerans]|nr:hypothetical protein J5TS2_32840 [Brevibacillus halotolerans]
MVEICILNCVRYIALLIIVMVSVVGSNIIPKELEALFKLMTTGTMLAGLITCGRKSFVT